MLVYMNEHEDGLRAGIAALRSGDRAEARRVLLDAVEQSPDSVAAWWLLAAVLDDPAHRIEALEQVLTLRPDHAEARRMLDRLTQPEDAQPGSAPDELDEDLTSPAARRAANIRARGDTLVAALVVIVAVLAILITVILVWSGALSSTLGVGGPNRQPTPQVLNFGAPACIPTSEGVTLMVFINNTGVAVDVQRGDEGSERTIFALAPGEQGDFHAPAGRTVRYTVVTDAADYTGGEASYEVPPGSMCRVPIQ